MRLQKPSEPEIIFEDNHLLVALKPPGMLSQADRTGHPDMLTLLKAHLKEKYNKPGAAWLGLVHRLDRPVGGVMLFAKTSKAAARLSQQIRERQLDKIYLAVVHGQVQPDVGQYCDWLSEKKRHGRIDVVTKAHGKLSLLDYTVLARHEDQDLSLVRISLITGRTHQIRVQFSHRGHPLAGDFRYGENATSAPGIKQIALFAAEIACNHPISGERLHFRAPLPSEHPYGLFVTAQNMLE